MSICPSCAGPVPQRARFCSRCGAEVPSSSEAPTAMLAGSGTVSSTGSLDSGRFTAGTILASRYRVIGLLGRGGMGEVYRADDLILAQAVALKFLPSAAASDAARLARFLAEVRIARQISHPNVCRVYDIGEVDGERFLSMEYVDGEDLASLLRRIGRFSPDKGVEVARQICAGLAAAHERGVVHRDLKPSNLMVDGRGKVRITDFGLAGLSGDAGGADARVGTPAYMAPEQLAGGEATFRSDLYALGLVLYEMFTGRPPFKRGTPEQMRREREEGSPAIPGSLVSEMDPAVERAILRCLEPDPASRPASALAVAASLPGGDPLAAALAAGETPAPEVVAAAGESGALKPATAWAALAGTLLGLAVALFAANYSLLEKVHPAKPPEVLADRARQILKELGQTATAADMAEGFSVDEDYLRYVRDHDPSPARWQRLESGRPAAITYWYRQSPRPMVARPGFTRVTPEDPPMEVSGMARVVLDGTGRLLRYDVVPPQVEKPESPQADPDWSLLFREAGLDPGRFIPVRSLWTPPVYADRRIAWKGSLGGSPEIPIRIEAAGYAGRPVSFRMVAPWTRPERTNPEGGTVTERRAYNFGIGIALTMIASALVLAWRNLKLGRGDRAGALKLGAFGFLAYLIVWLLTAHHAPSLRAEWRIFVLDLGYCLYFGCLSGLFYLALEPVVRRRWPEALISWSRLLAGRFRDPRVGRDILVGGLGAAGMQVLGTLLFDLPRWLGWLHPTPVFRNLESLAGFRWSVGGTVSLCVQSVVNAMAIAFLLLFLRILLRRQALAAGVMIAAFALFNAGLASDVPWLVGVMTTAVFLLFFVVIQRFGLLAAAVYFFMLNLTTSVQTSHLGAWYAGGTIVALLAFGGLVLYGFVVSLGGRPLFSGRLLEEG